MADDVTLRIRLTGEDDGAGDALGRAGDHVDGIGRKMKALGAVGLAAGAAAGGLLAKGFADNMNIAEANGKLQAQLGLTKDQASSAGKLAGEIYRDNWGDSISDVNDALKSVSGNISDLKNTSTADLKKMAESALALKSTFDVDVNDSTKAAGQLMKTGLAKNSKEAFDIITAGFQSGVDRSGDFLDTINEYSPQFSKLGITGKDALGILQSGLKAGAKDTDSIADAFKEFSLRAIDGSKSTADGFKSIGMNATATAEAIAKGGPKAEQATQATLQALMKIKDPVAQNTAGVALFGTQWEDTLRKILPALTSIHTTQDTVTGSTDQMSAALGDNGKAKIETAKRAFEGWTQSMASSKGPLGDVSAGVLAFGAPVLAAGGSIGALATGLAAMNPIMAVTKAATVVSTAAQWLWNAALTANPIGIIIVAIAALVAGLIYFFTQTKLGREIFSAAMSGIVTAFGWVKDKGGEAIKWIVDKWNGMMSFFKAAPGAITSATSGMWNGIWNGFKGVLNFIIRGWNSLHFSVPSFSFAGISTPGFNLGLPSIPYLASGGIVTGPTLAVLGEAGDEAVVPLSGSRASGFGQTIIVNVTNAVVGNEDAIQRVVTDAVRRATGRGYGTAFS